MFFKRKENKSPDHEFIQMDEAPVNATQVSKKVQGTDGSKDNNDETDIVYPSGLKLALLMMSCFVAMFLVALVSKKRRPHTLTIVKSKYLQDKLIITTAIPKITDDFHSSDNIVRPLRSRFFRDAN